MADLSVAVAGVELRNPVLSASGTFGHGLEMRQLTPPATIGGLVSKSVSLRPRQGNPAPRIKETHAGFLNSIGLENRGLDAYCRDVLPQMLHADCVVVTNIVGEAAEEYAAIAARLDGEEAVDVLEINLSCPNVQGGMLPFATDERAAHDVVRRVRAVTRKPLWAKLSPNVTRIADVGRACQDAGADAVTCINTALGLAVDWRTRRPGLALGMGGYSGPALKPIALRCAYECARALTIPVVGCGGVTCAEDVLEFLVAGCAAVQIGTASFADPSLPGRLGADLARLLDEAGIASARELVGSLLMPAGGARKHNLEPTR